jgi:hypothetical protein
MTGFIILYCFGLDLNGDFFFYFMMAFVVLEANNLAKQVREQIQVSGSLISWCHR